MSELQYVQIPLDIANMIDHTLLKPEAVRADIDALVVEAIDLGVFSICVSPSFLPVSVPESSGLKIATVCGFPSGKHAPSVKAAEAKLAVQNVADEVDMVIDIGQAKEQNFAAIEADIRGVRENIPAPKVLKVIIESAALTDHEIVEVCRAAETAGADFVKTSTGFHPAGGASAHAVKLMAETVGGRLGVKASGGIRTPQQAREMIAAGATRLGLSASATILRTWEDQPVQDEAGASSGY